MLTAALLTSLAASTLAQPTEEPAPPVLEDRPDLIISFSPTARYTTQADIKNEPGDFSLAAIGADLSFTFFPTEDITMIASVDHETANYDFSDATTLNPGTDSPLDLAYTTSLSLTSIIQHDETTSFLIQASVNNQFARGADFYDAFTLGVLAGIQWKVSEDFSIALGGGIRTRMENNTIVIPLINFRWQIDEQSALVGQGTTVTWERELDDKNTLAIRSGFEGREYRLDDDSTRASDGTLQHFRVPLALGWTHAPSPDFSITAEIGAMLWQEIEVRSGDGEKISSFATEPAAFFSITADFRF